MGVAFEPSKLNGSRLLAGFRGRAVTVLRARGAGRLPGRPGAAFDRHDLGRGWRRAGIGRNRSMIRGALLHCNKNAPEIQWKQEDSAR